MYNYISRQAAIDALLWLTDMTKDINYADGETLLYQDSAIENIKALPSVDAVEVVRCKNCKYFDSGTDEDGKLFFKCLGWVYGGTSEDDFCSHGERKDG